MRRAACIIFLAAMFGTIDATRAEEAQAPPRDTASLAAAAEAYASNPADEDRSQSPPNSDGGERRPLLETARSQDADQIPTLLKAAQYLDEAGLQDEAAKVRLLAARRRAEWQSLLAEKSAEFKKLQAEVDALRKALGDGQQVRIDFRILQVSRTHLRYLGFDWKSVLDASAPQPSKSGAGLADDQVDGSGGGAFPRVVERASKFFDVLELLGSRNVAKLIAEPSLATVDGRNAFVQIGDQAAQDELLMRVEILPTVAADGSITLELSLRMRDPHDLGPGGGFDFNNSGPPSPTREMQTAASLKPGQTLVARCEAARQRVTAESQAGAKQPVEVIEYLILATPKLVDLPAIAASPAGYGNAAQGTQR